MSWSYSGNPALNSKDAIRYLIGDTDSTEPLTTDEEIAWALTQNSNIYAAASTVASAISTYFARLAISEEIGPIKVQYTGRTEAYALKAKELAGKVGSFSQIEFFSGGSDVQARNDNASDSTIVQPIFTIGMNDFITSAIEDEI